MARRELFIERRTEEGDYAIRKPGSKKASDVCGAQAEAIERAGEIDPTLPFWWSACEILTEVPETNGESRESDATVAKQKAGQLPPGLFEVKLCRASLACPVSPGSRELFQLCSHRSLPSIA